MTDKQLDQVRLPFGKYKGELLTQVALDDPSYLRWMLNNVNLRGELRDAVELALDDSDGNPGEGWERFGSGWRKR